MQRRTFIKGSALAAAHLAASSAWAKSPLIKNPNIFNKVIILGMDGMDPNLVRRFVSEGSMPTFKRLIESNHFGELQTTMPPQSPVAWSSFITGTNPGGHGIFDFIHRDPKQFTPYLSTSRSFSGDSLKIGNWSVPLGGGRVDLMRKGTPFWDILEQHDIPSYLYQIPANFPITSKATKAVSGMGTPDLLGSYGTFTLFTEGLTPTPGNFEGGRVQRIKSIDHVLKANLKGPKNPFKNDDTDSELEIVVNRDPLDSVIRVTIGDNEVILKKGEWSEWLPIRFEILSPFSSIAGMVRLYVQDVHPKLRLYVSPINVDPMEPTLPICSPAGFSKELAEASGRFYTQGFPSDTKALSLGVFSDEEFLDQADIVLNECLESFDYQFSKFNDGVFFFYFSSTDQISHMMWRTMHPSHPLYDENASPRVKNALKTLYKKMDDVLAQTLSKVDNFTKLIVLSDHGFAPFEREFNLSTWLLDNGYTVLTDPEKKGEGEFYRYVDWSKTKAYALGLNGIYLNLRGREPKGIVESGEISQIVSDISAKLEKVTDPKNGAPIITKAYNSKELYSGPYVNFAPDIVVGYRRGYRISDESVLGKFPKEIVGDRTNKWSADHCSDPSGVPGIILTNSNSVNANPGLWDMAPSILSSFGFESPSTMTGKNIYKV